MLLNPSKSIHNELAFSTAARMLFFFLATTDFIRAAQKMNVIKELLFVFKHNQSTNNKQTTNESKYQKKSKQKKKKNKFKYVW
jgi:hypothetical protein